MGLHSHILLYLSNDGFLRTQQIFMYTVFVVVVHLSIYHRFCVGVCTCSTFTYIRNKQDKIVDPITLFFSVCFFFVRRYFASLFDYKRPNFIIFFYLSNINFFSMTDFCTQLKMYPVALFFSAQAIYSHTHIIHSFSTCEPILASLIDHLQFSTSRCICC